MANEVGIIIRNGQVVDGTGADPYVADLAIDGDTITQLGRVSGSARTEIDATGHLVTPGFIDAHSHLDGNVTFEQRLKPNSGHGITTTVMGNCGVGFAPCRESDREFTVALMEGVEDIPSEVLWAGLPWRWETYGEYRKYLSNRRFDMNVAGLLPHSCLRVYVMGQRAIDGELATAADIEAMSEIVHQAMLDGAIGVGSTRLLGQKTLSGILAPCIAADQAELVGIAQGMRKAGRGILQIAPEFNQYPRAEEELKMIIAVARETGCTITYSLKQTNAHKDGWRKLLDATRAANEEGLNVHPMVLGRPTGAIFSWECNHHRFVGSPGYQGIAALPLGERVAELAKAELRDQILAQTRASEAGGSSGHARLYELLFPIGEVPDYEPRPEHSVASIARRRGVHASEIIYDAMMRNEGRGVLLLTSGNYADGNLEPALEMMRFDTSVLGLADAGAHSTIICDASAPTFMLSYWARDRTLGDRLPLPLVIKLLSKDTADLFGFEDRGELKVGMKADVNVIDHAKLKLHPPRMEYDLPAGGRRLVQDADGYTATLVNGVVINTLDATTNALPGVLL
jgi:N-acyl-D-aspartate/D-glutamate deacylase